MTGTEGCSRWKNSLSAVVLLLASDFLCKGAYSQEFGGVPSEWREVARSEMMTVLDMIAEHVKGNYEKIRTWEVEYRVEVEDFLSPGPLPEPVARHVQLATNGIIQRTEFTMLFIVDMETNARYWFKQDPKLTWLKPDTREPVSIPNTVVLPKRSVCSAGEYLHFDGVVVPELADLPGHPQAQNKRVAYRDPVEYVQKQRLRDLLDPRVFFNNGALRLWDSIGKYKKEAKRLGDRLKLLVADGPGGPWYRIALSLTGGGLATLTFSPQVHFHPVRRIVLLEESGEKVVDGDERWEWKRFGEIYVPVKVTVSVRSGDPAGHYNVLRAELVRCILNKAVDRDQFTYKALGLKDGDLVMDRVNRQFLIHKNGSLVKLADFGERSSPPGWPSNPAISTARWVLVAASIVVLGGLVAALAIRRSRSRTG